MTHTDFVDIDFELKKRIIKEQNPNEKKYLECLRLAYKIYINSNY